MTKKIKIHPAITETTDTVFKKIGLKHSTALEEYAIFKATHKSELILEKRMLEDKEKDLKEDKEKIEKRLIIVKDKLNAIDELIKMFDPINSVEFEETVHIVKSRLEATRIEIVTGKWNVQKVPFDDIGAICRKRNMPVQAVMQQIPEDLKQYVEGYKF